MMVASKNCSITDIGPDSLSCTLMMDNGEGNEMLAIRVSGFSFNALLFLEPMMAVDH